jgi:hypothetical protein
MPHACCALGREAAAPTKSAASTELAEVLGTLVDEPGTDHGEAVGE